MPSDGPHARSNFDDCQGEQGGVNAGVLKVREDHDDEGNEGRRKRRPGMWTFDEAVIDTLYPAGYWSPSPDGPSSR